MLRKHLGIYVQNKKKAGCKGGKASSKS